MEVVEGFVGFGHVVYFVTVLHGVVMVFGGLDDFVG